MVLIFAMSSETPNHRYVVFSGRKPGIYTSWIDCYAQVGGYKDSVVRVYDNNHESETAWGSFSRSWTSTPKKKSELEKLIGFRV